MPWRDVGTVDLRMELVTDYRRGFATVTELAASYGISRRTVYKWIARFEREGPRGLADQSRRPHGHPRTTPAAAIAALRSAHRRFPKWSAAKLVTWLTRRGVPAPGRTRAYEILLGDGSLRAPVPRSGPRFAPRVHVLTQPTAPNVLWTTDFKGHFPTGDARRCYPLTLRDGFSRYVLRCDGLRSESIAATRPSFARAFAEYGLPVRMRMDNGRPFTGTGLAHLTQLSVWWLRLGIALERIRPGHPEENGSHEQFHGELKRHTARPPAATLRAQQRRFDTFCYDYNHERPHDALAGDVPARHYRSSARSLPARLPPLEYPGYFEVRRVATNGLVSWRGRALFVSEALRGESIGFEEIDDAVWACWLGDVRLACFDERQWKWC